MPDHTTVRFAANGTQYRMHPNEAVELGIQALASVYPGLGRLLTGARDGHLQQITHTHREGLSTLFTVWPGDPYSGTLADVLKAYDTQRFELGRDDEFIDVEVPTLSMLSAIDLSDVELPDAPPVVPAPAVQPVLSADDFL